MSEILSGLNQGYVLFMCIYMYIKYEKPHLVTRALCKVGRNKYLPSEAATFYYSIKPYALPEYSLLPVS